MYELDEDYFLRSDDLAKRYSENIINSLDKNKLGMLQTDHNSYNFYLFKNIFHFNMIEVSVLFHEIHLKKIIEDKLTNNTRVMNSIGRPIKIIFNQQKNKL